MALINDGRNHCHPIKTHPEEAEASECGAKRPHGCRLIQGKGELS